MDKKSINELKRRLKKDSCTFTKICGCYVDDNKNKVTNLDEIFMNLEDDEFYKYLEMAKKVMSTNIGNNILELNFSAKYEEKNEYQQFLLGLKSGGLKDQALVERFFDMVIEKYHSLGNYLILLYHDIYDVITKTSDNRSLDESEEVYEYIICAICPMILSKPGLGYNKNQNKIGTLNREWIVGMPETGFIYPAFIDRSSDINSVLMYTADSKNPHKEMIEDILGCEEKLTFAQQQDVLSDMVMDFTGEENIKDVMESVNIELAQVSNDDPEAYLSSESISSALEYAGIEEQDARVISEDYIKSMEEQLPLIGDIIPNKAAKIVKENNEKYLLKEEIKELNRQIANVVGDGDSDIIIRVASDKKDLIRRETIDGQTCVIIPVAEDEKVKIN